MNCLSRGAGILVGICLVVTTACRSSSWRAPQDLAALQAQRRQKVEKSIGLKRTEAELQLAQDAWRFGDRRACLSALDGILEREPGHVEALLLKAEVHLAADELIDADRSIAIALSHDPSNATAKRLKEIAQTKQLAEQRHSPEQPAGNISPIKLPEEAVTPASYTREDRGNRRADADQRPKAVPDAGEPDPAATVRSHVSVAVEAPPKTDLARVGNEPPVALGDVENPNPTHLDVQDVASLPVPKTSVDPESANEGGAGPDSGSSAGRSGPPSAIGSEPEKEASCIQPDAPADLAGYGRSGPTTTYDTSFAMFNALKPLEPDAPQPSRLSTDIRGISPLHPAGVFRPFVPLPVVLEPGEAVATDRPDVVARPLSPVPPDEPGAPFALLDMIVPGEAVDNEPFDVSTDNAEGLPRVSADGGESSHPIPVILTPEQAVAYERSDVPAGSTEVTDQSFVDDARPAAVSLESAIAAGTAASALAIVERRLTDNPDDPQIAISGAVSALEAGQPETAASIARLGIAFQPSCAALHRTLGVALYRSRKYGAAQVALQQALSLDNGSALSYFLLGCVSEKLGNPEAAEEHFARASELDPTFATRD